MRILGAILEQGLLKSPGMMLSVAAARTADT